MSTLCENPSQSSRKALLPQLQILFTLLNVKSPAHFVFTVPEVIILYDDVGAFHSMMPSRAAKCTIVSFIRNVFSGMPGIRPWFPVLLTGLLAFSAGSLTSGFDGSGTLVATALRFTPCRDKSSGPIQPGLLSGRSKSGCCFLRVLH